MQVSLHGVFFYHKLAMFFPLFFKYHVVFQDQSEDYICKDDIFYIIEVIAL